MKEWGHLLGGPESLAVAARVRDVTELLTGDGIAAGLPKPVTVAVHDPCHLIHAQRVAAAPREALRMAGYRVVDVSDSTVCCGAAGLYNLLRPDTAAELGMRKAQAVVTTGAPVVAVANPGCAMQIRRHLDLIGHHEIGVAHPVELIDT